MDLSCSNIPQVSNTPNQPRPLSQYGPHCPPLVYPQTSCDSNLPPISHIRAEQTTVTSTSTSIHSGIVKPSLFQNCLGAYNISLDRSLDHSLTEGSGTIAESRFSGVAEPSFTGSGVPLSTNSTFPHLSTSSEPQFSSPAEPSYTHSTLPLSINATIPQSTNSGIPQPTIYSTVPLSINSSVPHLPTSAEPRFTTVLHRPTPIHPITGCSLLARTSPSSLCSSSSGYTISQTVEVSDVPLDLSQSGKLDLSQSGKLDHSQSGMVRQLHPTVIQSAGSLAVPAPIPASSSSSSPSFLPTCANPRLDTSWIALKFGATSAAAGPNRMSYPREFKLMVINYYYSNGQNKYRTCKEFQITKSMLNGWLQKIEKIRQSRPGSLKSGRSGRKPQFPDIEKQLFALYSAHLGGGQKVGNRWIRETARQLAQQQCSEQQLAGMCQFSERWLSNFKKRYHINLNRDWSSSGSSGSLASSESVRSGLESCQMDSGQLDTCQIDNGHLDTCQMSPAKPDSDGNYSELDECCASDIASSTSDSVSLNDNEDFQHPVLAPILGAGVSVSGFGAKSENELQNPSITEILGANPVKTPHHHARISDILNKPGQLPIQAFYQRFPWLCRKNNQGSEPGRRGRKVQFPDVEKVLFQRLRQKQASGERISNRWLQEEARQLATQLCPHVLEEATKSARCLFSEHWLHNFKKRYGVTLKHPNSGKTPSSGQPRGVKSHVRKAYPNPNPNSGAPLRKLRTDSGSSILNSLPETITKLSPSSPHLLENGSSEVSSSTEVPTNLSRVLSLHDWFLNQCYTPPVIPSPDLKYTPGRPENPLSDLKCTPNQPENPLNDLKSTPNRPEIPLPDLKYTPGKSDTPLSLHPVTLSSVTNNTNVWSPSSTPVTAQCTFSSC